MYQRRPRTRVLWCARGGAMYLRAIVLTWLVAAACGPDNKHNRGGAGGGVAPPGDRVCDPATVHLVMKRTAEGPGTPAVEPANKPDARLDGGGVDACPPADGTPSSVGCHFFAVDLDNEAV